LLGTILSLTSAATFGMNAATIRRGVLTGSVIQGMSISLGLGLPFFLIISIVVGSFAQIWEFSTKSYILLALGGAIHFAFGRYCNYRATKAMGGILVRPLQQFSVILSLALAILFLGETLTPLRICGIILVLLGPLIMMRDHKNFTGKMERQNAEKTLSRIKFVPNYTEGIIFGIGSALGFGVSPVFVRAAIGDLNLTAAIAGGVVSYSAAAFVILLIILQPSRMRHVFAMSITSIRWFSFSAVLIAIAQMLRYMALAVAPVSVVTPIQQTTTIFQVIFAWIFNREHEPFGVWVLLGIFSSLLGAIALSVSTNFILTYFNLPEFMVLLADWRWP